MEISVSHWNADLACASDDEVITTIEEKFNIDLVPQNITWEDHAEKVKLWASTDSLADITSGYFRDLQIIKEVFLPAFEELEDCLQMATYIMEKINHPSEAEHPQQNMSYDDLFDFFARYYGDTFTKRTRLQSRKADCIMFLAENLDHIDPNLGRIYSSIGPHRYEWSVDDFVFIRLRRDANGNYEHSS